MCLCLKILVPLISVGICGLLSHPKRFWKHVLQFRKTDIDSVYLEINEILINNSRVSAEAFSKYFHSVYSSYCLEIFSFH
jgi:hypothetical protein